jgi:hypothetical protein
MDNLSTANSTDITSQIGALELGDNLESHDDGALESAGAYLNPPPQPTQVRTGCGLPLTLACRIDDGALLLASETIMSGPPPTARSGGCTILRGSCATDGALELGDHLESHSDGVLEAHMADSSAPTFYCYITKMQCIDDGALEAAGANVANPTGLGCKTQPAMCGY